MLQRQIMFKQLQELQRRQQLQELNGARNQDYVDQLMTSSRQASPLQLTPTVNSPIRDSRMLMFDNMQMMQQNESTVFQGLPSGLVLSQGQDNALGPMGMSPPQFDMSLYGNVAPNSDKSLNQYPYPQDLSNFSANLSTKSNNPSSIAQSFMTQQGNFSTDQSTESDGSLLSYQDFQEKNLFGQVPFHSSNSNHLCEGRLENSGWPHNSPNEVSKVDISETSATLDPLEEKILYSSDDHDWLSSFGTSSKTGGAGDFECTVENPSFTDPVPSIQRGSWSALMQSAVTETSSSDTVVQEEWSGFSFQNPEPSSDNQLSNLTNGENLQDNWVDRNLQNVSSPSSEPEQLFPKQNVECSFPGFQQSGKEFFNQKDEFQCESSPRHVSQLTDYNTQLKHPTGRDQTIQTSLLSENTWNPQYQENSKNGHELKDTIWHSNPVSGGFQTPFDQLNESNLQRYSVESAKMGPGDLGASDLYGQNLAAQSILRDSQDFGIRPGTAVSRTPQSYSLFPSLPTVGNSNVKSLPNTYEKDYINNRHSTPPLLNYMITKLPAYTDPSSPQINFQENTSSSGLRFSLLENVAVTQPSGTSVSSRHVGFSPGLLPLNFSKHEQNVGYHEQGSQKVSFLPESSIKLQNPTPLSSSTDSQQSLGKHSSEVDGLVSDSVSESRVFSYPMHQNYPLLHQIHRTRDGDTDSGKRFPFSYQQETANARELLLSEQGVSLKDTSSQEGVQHGEFSPANYKGNSLLSIGNISENRLNKQVDSAIVQGSKHLLPPSMLCSDVDLAFANLKKRKIVLCSDVDLAFANLKKRKIVAFDLEPWHKEVNSEAPRPQKISMAEFEWAQALGRSQEEARKELDIVVDVIPVIRGKRRLIFTTQLMQQIFRPPVASILFGDASSNCDYVAYSTARITLGDACNLNSKVPSDSADVSPEKLNTSKKTALCDFSKIVQSLNSRAEKLEGDLSRLDKSLSIVDIKVESQELEKFCTLNRFAKFHFRAHSTAANPASSSSPSIVQKTMPQRYVTASPMPKILPEDMECLSL